MIFSVSTDMTLENNTPRGSFTGNTRIYIKAIGIDQDINKNDVKVGPYKCIVNSINDLFLICTTTAATNTNLLYDLQVSITTPNGKSKCIAPKDNCEFDYFPPPFDDFTPLHVYTVPRQQVPGKIVNFYGRWRIDSASQIIKIELQDSQQEKYECRPIIDNNKINKEQNDFISCTLPKNIASGFYSIQIQLTSGLAKKFETVFGYTKDGLRQYDLAILPEIENVSNNTGGNQGQNLVINGIGFTKDFENIKVVAGGLDCKVTTSSLNSISCQIEKGMTQDIKTEQWFVSGGGSFQNRWEWSSGADHCKNQVFWNKDILKSITPQMIWTEPDLPQSIGDHYCMQFKGVFVPPRNGKYKFYVTGDEEGVVYLNLTPKNFLQSKLVQAGRRSHWSNYRSYFDQKSSYYQVGQEFDLVAGNMYYLEAYHAEGKVADHFTLSVETPAIGDDYLANSVTEIQEIKITYSADFEQFSIKVFGIQADQQQGDNKMSFQLKFQEGDFQYTTKKIYWDANSTEMKKHLDMAFAEDHEYDYNIDVLTQNLDTDGKLSEFGQGGTLWIITFQKLRPKNRQILPIMVTSYSQSYIEIVQKSKPSQGIQGSFSLSIDDKQVEIWNGKEKKWDPIIPFNVRAYQIQLAIQRVFKNYEVQTWEDGYPESGQQIYVDFKGPEFKRIMPKFKLVQNNLTGGKENTKPQVVISEFRKGSKRLFYEPIPPDMLFTYQQDKPQILIYVTDKNGGKVNSVCKNQNCEYIVKDWMTPRIDYFQLEHASQLVKFELNDMGSLGYISSDIKVKFAGQECILTSKHVGNSYQCKLQRNDKGIAIVSPGSWYPEVHVDKVGFASIKEGVQPLLIEPVISYLSNYKIFANGFQEITLFGENFPVDSNESAKIKIYFGKSVATGIAIKKVTSTQIVFLAPPKDINDQLLANLNVYVEYNNIKSKQNISVQYRDGGPVLQDMQIDGNDKKNTASPVLRTAVKLFGLDFGTDKQKLKIMLINQTNPKIQYLYTPTTLLSKQDEQSSLTFYLDEGQVGKYDVYVVHSEDGTSKQNPKVYIEFKVSVTSVYPVLGSIYGGNDLTISGENFSSDNLENGIFIESSKFKIPCRVKKSEKDIIVCTVDELQLDDEMQKYHNIDLNIVYYGKQTVRGTCEGSCVYKLSSTDSPTINLKDYQLDIMYAMEKSVLTGNKLNNGEVKITIREYFGLGLPISVQALSQTDNMIEFINPALTRGNYNITIQIGDTGIALKHKFFVPLAFIYNLPKKGSMGGEKVQINGNGFDPESNIKVEMGKLKNNQFVEIQGLCQIENKNNTDLFIRTPGTHKIGEEYTFRITQGSSQIIGGQFVTERGNSIEITKVSQNKFDDPALVELEIEGFKSNKAIKTAYLELDSQDKDIVFRLNATSINQKDGKNQLTWKNIAAGMYQIFIEIEYSGFVIFKTPEMQKIEVQVKVDPIKTVKSSFAGGVNFEINGNGFIGSQEPNFKQLNKVSLCGFYCDVQENSFEKLTCKVPQLITETTQKKYNLVLQDIKLNKQGTKIFSSLNEPSIEHYVMDNKYSTAFMDPNQKECFIGFDFGIEIIAELTKFEYYPSLTMQVSKFVGDFVQGSLDGKIYETIFTIGSSISMGKNVYIHTAKNQKKFRYIRVLSKSSEGKESSNCSYAEIEIFGHQFYYKDFDESQNSFTCSAILDVNGAKQTIEDAVTFTDDLTAKVISITPVSGSDQGGEIMTLKGNGFGNNIEDIEVNIEDIKCIVESVKDDEIKCRTGQKTQSTTCTPQTISKDQNSAASNIQVLIKKANAIVSAGLNYYYSLNFNMLKNQKNEKLKDNDSVIIDWCQTVLVTKDSVKINVLTVLGTLVFIGGKDITFNAQQIFVEKGANFLVGSKQNPFKNILKIQLYGQSSKFECDDCNLQIFGQIKSQNVFLSENVDKGSEKVSLKETPKNWIINDDIVLTSSSFENSLELVKLKKINGNSIETVSKLQFSHKQDSIAFGDQQISINSEAVNVSRNVQFVQESQKESFTFKIMGSCLKGLKVNIQSAEFDTIGNSQEPALLFEQTGDCPNVVLYNNVFKNAKNTFLSLENANYLNITQNIFLTGSAYGIELKDAIEQHNIFDSNLFLNITSKDNPRNAAFYITHPNNIIRNNKIIGSNQGIGFYFDLKENPIGKSQRSDICPIGSDLGIFDNNEAHNLDIGLVIKEFHPRKFPCLNMTQDNVELKALFSNTLLYNIQTDGLSAMKIGHLEFTNFTIGNSLQRNVHIQDGNYTNISIELNNLKLFGKLPSEQQQFKDYTGISLPQSNNLNIKEIHFKNFGEESYLFQTGYCHDDIECKNKNIYYKGGFNHNVSKAILTDSGKANICNWDNIQLDYIHEDGSLSQQTTRQTIIKEQPHLTQVKECKVPNKQFIKSLVCQDNVSFQEIQFDNIEPQNVWENHDMYIYNLNASQDYDKQLSQAFTHLHGKRKQLQQPYADSYIGIFVKGYGYHVFWDSQKDFTKLQIQGLDQKAPQNILFRFNHTEQRELFEVSSNDNKLSVAESLEKLLKNKDAVNQISTWYHQPKEKLFYFSFGSVNATEKININGIYCQKYCSDNSCGGRTPITRKWSDKNLWQTQALRKRPNEQEYKTGEPSKYDTVYIPCFINLLIDVDLVEVYSLVIDGVVKFDDSFTPKDNKEIQFKANFIWVRLGSLQAGTMSKPYQNNLNIILTGKEDSSNFKQDLFDVGNKLILVNGILELNGKDPEIKNTRLIQPAKPEDTFIKVESAIGFNVGDEIVLSSSSYNYNETERFKIVSIEEIKGRKINLSDKIKYYHYGNQDLMISMADDYVDMRSTVSLLNRNIKITGEIYQKEQYGGKILLNKRKIVNPDTNELISNKAGGLLLLNVEVNNLGQKDKYAGISIEQLDGLHDTVQIKYSTIYDCHGICLEAKNSERVKLKENVFFNGQHRLASIIDSNQWDIQQNYFIHVNNSTNHQGQTIALEIIQNKNIYDAQNDKVSVFENVITGSPELGMYIPAVQCNQFTTFQDNTVSATQRGVKFKENDKNQCQMFGNVNIFHSKIGLKIDSETDNGSIQISSVKLYENNINLDLSNIKINNLSDLVQNKVILTKSHIGHIKLKDCQTCYLASEQCSDSIGIIMPKFFNKNNQPAYNQAFLITDVQFYNYADKYQQYSCKNNYAFVAQNIFGSQSGVYMQKSKCIDCIPSGYLKILESDTKECGQEELKCTGNQNLLIQDFDGQFSNKAIQQAIITNEQLAKAYKCEILVPIQLYQCNDKQFGILEIKSLTVNNNAKDNFLAPVNITIFSNDNKVVYINQVSHQQQIEGKSLQQFQSIVEIQKSHDISFNQDQFPYRSIFSLEPNQIQIDKEDYVTIRLFLNRKLSIAIFANGKDNIKTISNNQKINSIELAQQLQKCGSNMYDLDKKSVQFLLRSGCSLEIQLRNAVHFNLHLALKNPEDFAKGDNQEQFIKSLSMFLNIDEDRVKILKVTNIARRLLDRFLINSKLSEVIVSFMIEGSDLSDNQDYSPIKDQQFLDSIAQKLKQELKKDKSSVQIGANKVIQVDYTTLVADKTGSVQEQTVIDKERIEINVFDNLDNKLQVQVQEDIPLIIIFIVILILMVIIIAIVIVYFYMKTKSKILQPSDINIQNLDITQQDLAKNNNDYDVIENNQTNGVTHSESEEHSEDIDSHKEIEQKIPVNQSINLNNVNLNFEKPVDILDPIKNSQSK